MRREALADFAGKNPVLLIGEFVVGLLLLILYSVLPAVIIMGIAGALRPNRVESPEIN
jgi:hypothetical protein